MRTKCIIALIFTLLTLSAGLLWADCRDFSRITSWSIEGDQKIIFYQGPVRVAEIMLQGCRVSPDSNVQLPKAYLCESDKIIIDGEECNLISLDSLE